MSPEDTAGRAGVHELLTQIADGSARALGLLYDEISPQVHAVSTAALTDSSAAEHATEAVFVQLWRAAPQYRSDSQDPRRWILAIAYREIARRRTGLGPTPGLPETAVQSKSSQHPRLIGR